MKIQYSLALALSLLAAIGSAACSSGNKQDSGLDVGTLDSGTTVTDSGAGTDAGGARDTGVSFDAAPAGDALPAGDATPADAGIADAAPDAAGMDATSPDATTPDTGGVVYYVDPVQGLDTNPGTQAMPYKSIRVVSDVITQRNDPGPYTVYLADGTYSAGNQNTLAFISFAHPTFLVGSAPGNVTIMGQPNNAGQENMQFVQGGGIRNVTFNHTWQTVHAMHGTFTMAGCSVVNTGAIAYFTGDVVATLDTTHGATISGVIDNFGDVYVDNTANVTWLGGGTTSITGGSAGQNLVFIRGGGRITIEGVNVTNYAGYVVTAYDQASVTVRSSTITGSGFTGGGNTSAGAFYLGGSQSGAPAPTLILDHVNVTHSLGHGIAVSLTGNTATVSITLVSSHLDRSMFDGLGIFGNTNPNLRVNISATNTTFDNNGLAGIASPRASLTFSGTGNSVSSNGDSGAVAGVSPGGILISDAASVNSLIVRNAAIGNNSPGQIEFAGASGSVLDLGTAASPGGVVFSGVTTGHTALNMTALITGTAIGDTWMPNAQGSNSAGMYTTAATITGPAMGLNVTVPQGASVVVAQ